MRHRGPDEGGVWHDDDVAIGFRRLSIIDIDHSHQPLPWLDGRYQLIFNGEIYNYLELRERLAREFGALFDTDGDGEAIVAGYHYLGPKIVRELRGMFAFLIWDAQERVLFGARDWFGIKPLLHLHRRARHVLRQREEVAARRRRTGRRGGGRHAPRCSTTSPCSTCPSRRRCTRAHPPHRVRHLLHDAPRRAAAPAPLLPPGLRDQAGAGRRTSCTARSPRRSRTRSRSTCATDVTVGLVPVRWHRLDRDRRPGQAAQPEPADVHHRLRARGLQRDRRGRRVGRGDRRRAHHQGRRRPRR